MICPKCEEGIIEPVTFKHGGKQAFVCDLCDTLWFNDEDITEYGGHPFTMHYKGEEFEYTADTAGPPQIDQRAGYASYK